MEWLPAAQQAARASAHRPTALATGRPVTCSCATRSWSTRRPGRTGATGPRMIAQPGVALHGQYALRAEPGETPPPVQQAILDSLAAAAW